MRYETYSWLVMLNRDRNAWGIPPLVATRYGENTSDPDFSETGLVILNFIWCAIGCASLSPQSEVTFYSTVVQVGMGGVWQRMGAYILALESGLIPATEYASRQSGRHSTRFRIACQPECTRQPANSLGSSYSGS